LTLFLLNCLLGWTLLHALGAETLLLTGVLAFGSLFFLLLLVFLRIFVYVGLFGEELRFDETIDETLELEGSC
jgi:hypothetical protein